MNAAKRALWIAVGTLALGFATGASAETFLDVYAGRASTKDADFEIDVDTGGPPVSFSGQVDFDNSVAGGLRLGHWFGGAPFLGIAGDVSGFAPELTSSGFDAQAVVVPISLMLMLRAPLGATDDMPGGRVQPYAAVGPGAFVTAAKLKIPGTGDVAGATASLGLDVRGGVRILLTSGVSLFAEYRYTRFEAKVDDSIGGFGVNLDTKFRTRHVSAGIGFLF